MYNKIILVGNLTRDIEMRFSQSGTAIANSAIATSRKFKSTNIKQKEEVCFIDITFFGKISEIAHQYLKKGSKILIDGRLSFVQWTDQNGQKRSKHSVIVDNMQMMDKKIDKVSIQTASQLHSPNENKVDIPKNLDTAFELDDFPF